jgi:hypothetical protein
MAGRRLMEELTARGASVNEIRAALGGLYSVETWRRSGMPPTYMPWGTDPARQAEFEQLLRTDRTRNHEARLRYYTEIGLMLPCVGWVETTLRGGHCGTGSAGEAATVANDQIFLSMSDLIFAGYAVSDSEELPPFAYSIGLNYWYGVSDIFVCCDGGTGIGGCGDRREISI